MPWNSSAALEQLRRDFEARRMNNPNIHADVTHDPETDFGILKPCCAWTENDEYWETECGHSFIFCDCAQPTEHKFRFCPFCGNTLIEKRENP